MELSTGTGRNGAEAFLAVDSYALHAVLERSEVVVTFAVHQAWVQHTVQRHLRKAATFAVPYKAHVTSATSAHATLGAYLLRYPSALSVLITQHPHQFSLHSLVEGHSVGLIVSLDLVIRIHHNHVTSPV